MENFNFKLTLKESKDFYKSYSPTSFTLDTLKKSFYTSLYPPFDKDFKAYLISFYNF